jgi:uncharacterized delta-60 repeat protein
MRRIGVSRRLKLAIYAFKQSLIAIQPDGRVILVGSAYIKMSTYGSAIARLNTDGSLDSSFGSGGKVTIDILGVGNWVEGMALQADGKIVVAGMANEVSYVALARHMPGTN